MATPKVKQSIEKSQPKKFEKSLISGLELSN